MLLLVNKATTVLNFRAELIEALVAAGYRVTVAVPPGERLDEIEALGATVVKTPMKKDGITPTGDLRLLGQYRRLIHQLQPAAVLTYTVKPNVYGALACGRTPLIATVTGRGQALSRKGFLQSTLLMLYRLSLRSSSAVFFQNTADRAFFEAHGIAPGRHRSVAGSGVNLERFAVKPLPAAGPVSFAFISRLMPPKGVDVFVETARRVRAVHPDTRFHVCGFGDPATERRMAALAEEGVIHYHGRLTDVRPLLADVHCVIHPSDYPEGLSNILLEAAATGRAVITTDRPGCREAVLDGASGFLVPPRDADATVTAVERFLALSLAEQAAMGACGRALVESGFDRRRVVATYMAAVREVTREAPDALSQSLGSPVP